MAGRYDSKVPFANRHLFYEKKAKDRGKKFFRHYGSPNMHKLTEEELEDITVLSHVWAQGDRYFKLSYEHYGDPEFWWIIAWYNEKPTEAHISLGEIVYIPHPVEDMLGFYYSK